MAAMTLAASAQLNWKASAKTNLEEDDDLVDNSYASAVAALNSDNVASKQFLDDSNNPVSKTINGVEFNYFVQTRVTDLPAAANDYQGTEAEGSIAVNIEPNKNTDVQIYARIGSSKTITLYDATDKTVVSLKNSFEETDGENILVVAVGQLQNAHKYVLCMKGGTMALCGLNFVAGTYVEPTDRWYANVAASAVDGFSTMTYGDGAKVILMKEGKNWSNGSSITVDGTKYTSSKVSNGAQNKYVAPVGKVVKKFTIYSYVNVDAKTARPCFWKEVAGVTYSLDGAKGTVQTTEMECYKGTTPDVYSYNIPNLKEVTFTNSGEQACFVLDVELADASSAPTVKQQASQASQTIKRTGANGLEIISGTAIYNVAGQQK